MNPDPEYRAEWPPSSYKEDAESKEEIYLVAPDVAKNWRTKLPITTLYLAINRQGEIFIWVCREPKSEKAKRRYGGDVKDRSRRDGHDALRARAVAIAGLRICIPRRPIVEVEPNWPDKPFKELVELAFIKNRNVYPDLNHPGRSKS